MRCVNGDGATFSVSLCCCCVCICALCVCGLCRAGKDTMMCFSFIMQLEKSGSCCLHRAMRCACRYHTLLGCSCVLHSRYKTLHLLYWAAQCWTVLHSVGMCWLQHADRRCCVSIHMHKWLQVACSCHAAMLLFLCAPSRQCPLLPPTPAVPDTDATAALARGHRGSYSRYLLNRVCTTLIIHRIVNSTADSCCRSEAVTDAN